jgi:excisionase family DNA binding protein
MKEQRRLERSGEGAQGTLETVAEFAERSSLKESCVRRWLLEGRLAYVKLGRLTRIPSTERDRLVREGFRPARARA